MAGPSLRGLELSRRLYFEVVRPILLRRFPGLAHAAALIGSGSEVLGLDDDVSTDHAWGLRLQIFPASDDGAAEITGMLAAELPLSFAGVSTHFGESPDEPGTRVLESVESGPVAHGIEVVTVRAFLRDQLGVDSLCGWEARDWLVTPSQRLLELTAGEVFVDEVGELTAAREALTWYPHDVWLLLLAGHWRRVAQLEHLHGRAGSRGDELGSNVIAASLVRDLMRLAFLQERRYAPYPKWLGRAYADLGRGEAPALAAVVEAADWRARERTLADAYRELAQSHNRLGVTPTVDPEPREFFGRGFAVLFADRFVDALRAAIKDDEIRAIDHEAGGIDAVTDNTDVLTRPYVWRRLAGLYDRGRGV